MIYSVRLFLVQKSKMSEGEWEVAMERKTHLYDCHIRAGGKMVPFAGYLLPVQYDTGVITEHMAVRTEAG